MAVHFHCTNKRRTISALDRQIHAPSMPYVSVWFGLRAIERRKTIFIRSNMVQISMMMPIVPALYRYSTTTPTTTTNDKRHEYTCNLLICLICSTLCWARLSNRGIHGMDPVSIECNYVTPQSIRWYYWHRLLRQKIGHRCCWCGWLGLLLLQSLGTEITPAHRDETGKCN